MGGKAPRRGGVGHGRRRRGGLRLGYVMEEEEGLTGGPGASAGGERSCAARRRLEPGARLGRGKEQRGRKKTGVRDGPSANWASAEEKQSHAEGSEAGRRREERRGRPVRVQAYRPKARKEERNPFLFFKPFSNPILKANSNQVEI